jgi:hypothetical protein
VDQVEDGIDDSVIEIEQLRKELETLQGNASLNEPSNLLGRAKALKWLCFAREVTSVHQEPATRCLDRALVRLRQELEAIDQKVFAEIERKLLCDNLAPDAIRRLLASYTGYRPAQAGKDHIGRDGLDVLLDGVLFKDPIPGEGAKSTSEMVHYEAAPARLVFDLVDRLEWSGSDVFYDLGSGLGRIVLLFYLITGIPAKGVESDPALCEYAHHLVEQLSLSQVEFLNVDARDANLAEGTVFFMFTPFVGQILQQVMEKLCQVARQHPIKVATFGPCTPTVARHPWLVQLDRNADYEFRLALFQSDCRRANNGEIE